MSYETKAQFLVQNWAFYRCPVILMPFLVFWSMDAFGIAGGCESRIDDHTVDRVPGNNELQVKVG